MSQFWLFAGLLSVVAVAFVVWPLLRSSKGAGQEDVSAEDQDAFVLDLFNENREELQEQLSSGEITQQEFEQLQQELQRSLLEDAKGAGSKNAASPGWPLAVLALLVVVGSVGFYAQRGAIADVEIQALLGQRFEEQLRASQEQRQADAAVTEKLLLKLQERVKAGPEQDRNRYLLARLAAESGRYGVAVQNYTHLLQSGNQHDARLMAELAQVVFLASGNRVTPEVSVLVEKTLEINPQETTALGLAGIEAFEQQQFQLAIDRWTAAVREMPVNSPVVQGLMAGIERARAMLQSGAGGEDVDAVQAPQEEGDEPRLTVAVSVAQGVAVPAEAFVMVYAREWGGRMPLAIARFNASDLPRTVTLDRSMSMMPGMDIGSVAELEVIARISTTGSAEPQPGDWQISKGPVVLSEALDGLSLIVSEQLR